MSEVRDRLAGLVKVGEEFNRKWGKVSPHNPNYVVSFGWFTHCPPLLGRAVLRRLTEAPEWDRKLAVRSHGEENCNQAIAWLLENYEPALRALLAALPAVEGSGAAAWFAATERCRLIAGAVEELIAAGAIPVAWQSYLLEELGQRPLPQFQSRKWFSGIDNHGTQWAPRRACGASRPEGWRPTTPKEKEEWLAVGWASNSNNSSQRYVRRSEFGSFLPHVEAAVKSFAALGLASHEDVLGEAIRLAAMTPAEPAGR